MSSTGTSIAIIEKNLPMDRIRPMVEALDMDHRRFISTVMLAVEKNPRLMDFPVQQHVQWASSAAVLGLEPDGVTGQAFPIPFGGNNPKVQLIVGYKGFNTMAGRAGITINGGAIYEGDEWDQTLSSGHPFALKQAFGSRASAKLLGVWAQPQMPNGFFGHPLILDMSEILAVKAKSPGARKKDSPWNDVAVGFPAMAQKTAVRRLQRTLPSLITPGRLFSTHGVGAQMDMLHEEAGKHSTVDLEGHLHDHGAIQTAMPEAEIKPEIIMPDGLPSSFGSFANYANIIRKVDKTEDVETLVGMVKANKDAFTDWRVSGNDEALEAANALSQAFEERITTLNQTTKGNTSD